VTPAVEIKKKTENDFEVWRGGTLVKGDVKAGQHLIVTDEGVFETLGS